MSTRGSRFTQAERAEAIGLASKIGAAAAGERLEISPSTIRTWLSRATQEATAAVHTVERLGELTAITHTIDNSTPAEPNTSQPESPETGLPITQSIGRALELLGEAWTESRAAATATALDDIATLAMVSVERAIVQGRSRDARELAVTLGVLLDKAALVGARPQRITESHSTSTHVEHHQITVETSKGLARQVAALRSELAPSEPIDTTSTPKTEESHNDEF